MKDATALQVEIVRDGNPRIIPEDVEIALDKIGFPIGTFSLDEIEDFASTAIMVQPNGDRFDFSDESAAHLKAQVEADTGGVVEVLILD